MSQPNVTVLVSGRNEKPPFWYYNTPPVQLITHQPPVRSLKTVPLDMKPSTSVQPSNIPPKPETVALVDDNSPITSITSNTTNKIPVLASKTPIIAANTVINFTPRMTKRKPKIIYTIKNFRVERERIEKLFAKKAGQNNAANITTSSVVIPSGDARNKPNATNEPNVSGNASNKQTITGINANETYAGPSKVLSKWQRRKLRRKLEKLEPHMKNIPTTNKNRPGPAGPQKIGGTTPSTKALLPGFTIPKLVPTQKPTIVLKTKKNLETEMAKQQMTFTKPDSNAAENEPATLTGSEAPNRTVKATKVPGVFTVEQPLQATQRGQGSANHLPIYAYKYPKGIPRSFLKNVPMPQNPGGQQMTQILGDQQMAPVPGNQQIITSDSPIWPNVNMTMPSYQANPPTLVQTPQAAMGEIMNPASSPIFVQTENQPDVQQPYSPSDIYSEPNPEPVEELESPETPQNQSAQKRLSAFHRLGPLSQPKKPKLTINLTLNKEQPVREVINDTDDDPERYTPGHLRKNIINSTDETVVKYLPAWPWKKNFGLRRSATARHSRSVMILEQEQMEEAYDKDNFFIQILVRGYPSTWTKERVLDAIIEKVKGYSLIPCFTEFYQHECKFLTLRSRSALITLHKTGFYIHKDGVELTITISQTDLTLNQIDFIPRIVLRKRVGMGYSDKKLNLSAFTLQEDISHFIYYPLNHLSNQSEFIKLQSVIAWDQLTDLDLSHNRLTDISGFELNVVTPRLKHLDLSHNYLQKITMLLRFKGLLLKSLKLEGNPLCNDYIDPDHYVKVVRLMFPTVCEIDGIPIHRQGELAHFKQNYCTDEAKEVAEKFLEIYFPLLDSGPEHRSLIQGMYEDDAMLTITYCYKLRYGPIYRCFRNLFLYARFLDEGETDSVVGAMSITKLINRWPQTEHDPFTFTVDVIHHTETTTILRIGGILKLTAETLAEDEHLLSFTRTVVLYSEHGDEYKIHNEMVYWDEPTSACARSAFRVNTISQKKINLKIEATTDQDLREKFVQIFMKLTTMDKKISERCLEMNDWNFKLALEHFTKLLKSKNLDSLIKEVPSS